MTRITVFHSRLAALAFSVFTAACTPEVPPQPGQSPKIPYQLSLRSSVNGCLSSARNYARDKKDSLKNLWLTCAEERGDQTIEHEILCRNTEEHRTYCFITKFNR